MDDKKNWYQGVVVATIEEKIHFYEWQLGMSGSFVTCLLDAFKHADVDHRPVMNKAFPGYAELFDSERKEPTFWKDLVFEVETHLGRNMDKHARDLLRK